jgi:hypothetical protein
MRGFWFSSWRAFFAGCLLLVGRVGLFLVLFGLLAFELREMRPPGFSHAIVALSSVALVWAAGRILNDPTAVLRVVLHSLAIGGIIGGGVSFVLMTSGDWRPATQRVVVPLLCVAIGVAALVVLRWLHAKWQGPLTGA